MFYTHLCSIRSEHREVATNVSSSPEGNSDQSKVFSLKMTDSKKSLFFDSNDQNCSPIFSKGSNDITRPRVSSLSSPMAVVSRQRLRKESEPSPAQLAEIQSPSKFLPKVENKKNPHLPMITAKTVIT